MLQEIYLELKKPASIVGGLFLLVGIPISFAIGYYFYYIGLSYSRISYSLTQNKIFDASAIHSVGTLPGDKKLSFSTAPITINSRIGPIEKNVFSATISVWNSGNSSISKSEDKRNVIELAFQFPDKAKLIDVIPQNYSSNNVDEFEIDDRGFVRWATFDANQGFTALVLYASDDFVPMQINGYIAGILDNKMLLNENHGSLELIDIKFVISCLFIYIIICPFFISGMLLLFKDTRNTTSIIKNPSISSAVTVAMVIIFIQFFRMYGNSMSYVKPPFEIFK